MTSCFMAESRESSIPTGNGPALMGSLWLGDQVPTEYKALHPTTRSTLLLGAFAGRLAWFNHSHHQPNRPPLTPGSALSSGLSLAKSVWSQTTKLSVKSRNPVCHQPVIAICSNGALLILPHSALGIRGWQMKNYNYSNASLNESQHLHRTVEGVSPFIETDININVLSDVCMMAPLILFRLLGSTQA